MSPNAKYGWAVGLVIGGVVLALPFRNNPGESSPVAKTDVAQVESDETELAGQLNADADQNKTTLTQSPLLPEKTETNTRKMIGQYDDAEIDKAGVEPKKAAGQIVEEVPNKFPKEELQPQQKVVQNDRAATLRPVEFSRNHRKMPDSVGPYRMKPVPSGKFRRASQSNIDRVFSNASRSRKVVHYKLRDGDSLRSIAQRYLGDGNRFQEILADNRHILTNGENFLPVGQYITIIVQ